jgi:hypothetical protein
VISIRRCRAFRVAQATCGVMMQFFAVSSGFDAGGGSTVSTSSPAPASRPAFSAAARSASFTSAPRAVFKSSADGFISPIRLASIISFVSGVSGQCRLTTSLSRNSVSRSTHSGPVPGVRRWARIRIPKALPTAATLWPIRP